MEVKFNIKENLRLEQVFQRVLVTVIHFKGDQEKLTGKRSFGTGICVNAFTFSVPGQGRTDDSVRPSRQPRLSPAD